MSSFLFRLGQFAFRRRWLVVGVWSLLLAVVIGVLVAVPPTTSSALRIDGTASQEVLDKLTAEFPNAAGSQGFITFAGEAGDRVDSPENAAAIATAAKDIAANDYVIQQNAENSDELAQLPPEQAAALISQQLGGLKPLIAGDHVLPNVLVSDDGTVALLNIQLSEQVDSMPTAALDSIKAAAAQVEETTTLRAIPSASLNPRIPNLAGLAEAIGLLVAAIVLILTLGSLITAGLPLLTALVGVGIGVGGAFGFSHVITLSSITPVLALMVGLAVGIDYALFIVNRQRRLIVDRGLSASEAAARAVGTAGSAVVFAGLTVLIALIGLSVIGIEFLTTMAFVAAATVAVAVLIAITLLPALLGFVGERVVGPRARRAASNTRKDNHPVAHRFVNLITRHRILVVAAVVIILGVIAIPATSISLGLPSAATANTDSSERQSYDLTSKAFGEGFNGQLILAVTSADGSAIADTTLQDLTAEVSQVADVDLVLPGGVNSDRTTAIVAVVPTTGPDSPETRALVQDFREMSDHFEKSFHVTLGVTGLTAVNIDISDAMANALPLYLAVIVVLSLIIMLLVFRSILIPVQATVGFLLSILATLGVITLVFQEGWFKEILGFDTPGPILSFLPILVTGILYGLAMDYQVFLVSSMRESHVHGHAGVDGVKRGFEHASKVVVAAAVIMVAVFAGFAFNDDIMIKQIGLALAVGILLDAFLVRMTLTPALLTLFGERAWWLPRWLDRIIPDLDIEGDKLARKLAGSNPTAHETTARPPLLHLPNDRAVAGESSPIEGTEGEFDSLRRGQRS